MDKIDVAIIRELNQGGLILPGKPGFSPSYRDVSKKTGISLGYSSEQNKHDVQNRSGEGVVIVSQPQSIQIDGSSVYNGCSSGT